MDRLPPVLPDATEDAICAAGYRYRHLKGSKGFFEIFRGSETSLYAGTEAMILSWLESPPEWTPEKTEVIARGLNLPVEDPEGRAQP